MFSGWLQIECDRVVEVVRLTWRDRAVRERAIERFLENHATVTGA